MKKSLSSEKLRTLFNFHRIEKIKQVNDRSGRCYIKSTLQKQENCEKILVLAERLRKKSALGKFYKQLEQNIAYFNKEQVFSIRTKPKIDKMTYYLFAEESKKWQVLNKKISKKQIICFKE